MTKWAIAVVILAACGSKKTTDTGGGSGDGSSTPVVVPAGATFPKLSVVIDGKPVVMESALVKRKPDGAMQLYLTPKKVAKCQELLSNVFDGKGDQSVLVDLPVFLGADGKEFGGVGDIYMGAPRAADAGTSKVGGPTTKDAKVDVELAFTGTNGRGQKLELHGTVSATGCGDQPDEPDMGIPKTTHASTAKMTIAGKTFAVAAIRKGKTIELVDYPRQCLVAKYLGVRITKDGDSWKLDGKRIKDEKLFDPSVAPIKSGSGSGSGSAVEPSKPTWKITPGKEAKGVGSGSDATDATVELALEGEGKIGDYPIKLEGSVEAIDCK